MCGIAGILSRASGTPPTEHEIRTMVTALHHRGPDGHGVYLDGPVGLGHARLSIIDISGGAQPMANEDSSLHVVFNGEVFNYLELRKQLIARGHRFRSESDTEVIVHLYEEHGDDFVKHLNGQFAIALWDAPRQRLVLARDRVGIRPLFHTSVNGRFAFASEIKALLTLPAVPRRLDANALASVFSYWSVLPPGSLFEHIDAVPPGHLMVVDDDGAHCRRYWDWPFGATATSETPEQSAETLKELLIDAVRLQLRADVPVGAYLSGGLDSSIIVALIRNHTATPLRTFSLTFDDKEFDESTHQQELVRHLATQHSSVRATARAIGDAFARMVWHAESPVIRSAPIPMMLLADSVRTAGYKVVLTGEGADEAFGGYDLFKEAKLRRWVARTPTSLWRSRLAARLYPYLEHSPAATPAFARTFFAAGLDQIDKPWFAHLSRLNVTRRAFQFFQADWRERLQAWNPLAALEATLPTDFMQWEPMARDQYIEAQTLMSGYLLSSQGDRMAMAASIETRYPFLDHRVLEFACRLPARQKMRGMQEKVLLKRAMAAELPASIHRRPKQPYRSPDSACFFADGRPLPYVAEILSPSRLNAAGLFDAAAVAKLVEKCRAGRAIGFGDNMALVGIVSTMLLHEQFIGTNGAPQSQSVDHAAA